MPREIGTQKPSPTLFLFGGLGHQASTVSETPRAFMPFKLQVRHGNYRTGTVAIFPGLFFLLVGGFSPTHLKNMRVLQIESSFPQASVGAL